MIHREHQNGAVILRMEHGKVSALDLELLQELREKLAQLQKEPPRAVVLTGTGSCFFCRRGSVSGAAGRE